MYSIWLLEYAHVYKQPMGSVLAGQHNAGFRELSFTYMLIKGNGHTILVDTGTDGNDPVTQELHKRDDVNYWQQPKNVLAKVGITPDDVDTVLITHAHYDHMDNMSAFKNAKFIIQEKELTGWVGAMLRDKKFSSPHMALKKQNIMQALQLVDEGRMITVNGEVRGILPDIDLYPAYDGHTFGSQIVVINNGDKKWLSIGDLAYVNENFTGIDGSGVYVPVGIAVGSPYDITQTLDDILRLADGKREQVVIGHETDNWQRFPSHKGKDGLWIAEIALAPKEISRI